MSHFFHRTYSADPARSVQQRSPGWNKVTVDTTGVVQIYVAPPSDPLNKMVLRGKTFPAMSDAIHWTVLITEVHLAKYCMSKHALLHIACILRDLSPSYIR